MPVIFVFHKDIRYRLDAVHTGGMEVQRSCRGHVGMSASEPRRIVNMLTCSRTQCHRNQNERHRNQDEWKLNLSRASQMCVEDDDIYHYIGQRLNLS